MTHSRTANHSETKQSWQIRLNHQTIEWCAKNHRTGTFKRLQTPSLLVDVEGFETDRDVMSVSCENRWQVDRLLRFRPKINWRWFTGASILNVISSILQWYKGNCRAGAKRAIEWRSPCTASHLCLSQFSILEEYLVNLGLFMPYPEQRVSLENISSVQGNIILCEILKTNLCISQFQMRPGPPPRADPREFAFFFLWMANSRGRGHLSCQMPGGRDESRRQMPRYT